MSRVTILGVVLVRNEDRFLRQVLQNTAEFCDRFLLFDNGSADESPEILRQFAREHPAATFSSIRNPGDSHEALKPFAGSPTWVFGVDGDEIYDPACLAELKPQIQCGEYDSWWMLSGHCLHTEEINGSQAVGFMAPPSRSITKLYNFAAIDAWPGPSNERLHGGQPAFRHGFDGSQKKLLFEETFWEDSPLRCLHTCFLARSSRDGKKAAPRPNIDEIYGSAPLWRRMLRKVAGGTAPSAWKRERYRRGPRVAVDTQPFFGTKLH